MTTGPKVDQGTAVTNIKELMGPRALLKTSSPMTKNRIESRPAAPNPVKTLATMRVGIVRAHAAMMAPISAQTLNAITTHLRLKISDSRPTNMYPKVPETVQQRETHMMSRLGPWKWSGPEAATKNVEQTDKFLVNDTQDVCCEDKPHISRVGSKRDGLQLSAQLVLCMDFRQRRLMFPRNSDSNNSPVVIRRCGPRLRHLRLRRILDEPLRALVEPPQQSS